MVLVPPLGGVYHGPFPNPYRRPAGQSEEACAAGAIEHLEDQILVHLVSPDEVAAVIVEPIQGEGGYVVPPVSFFERLRELTRKHGILLVTDEVQSGMGRTGRMWACEYVGIVPDILTSSKGLGGGVAPVGATIARPYLWDALVKSPLIHTTTFGNRL